MPVDSAGSCICSHSAAICSHCNLVGSSQYLLLLLCKSLSAWYWSTQQAVQTNICVPSKASFDVIRLAVTVRCEAVRTVTGGWCPSGTDVTSQETRVIRKHINPLNTELNPIYHLLALLGAHYIFQVSGLRVN